jgi:triose/dihydroxyacetone kinase / FAD-AMP lyase (cyclizing)
MSGDKAEVKRSLEGWLGGASYVGEASGQELRDPGAWALYEMGWGFAKGVGLAIIRTVVAQ